MKKLSTLIILLAITIGVSAQFGSVYDITRSTVQPWTYPCDLDNDGDFDILVSSFDNTSWYENFGNGNFSLQKKINSLYGKPHSADLDNDGDLDIIILIHITPPVNTSDILWMENLGNANFFGLPKSIESITGRINDIDTADVDGDGDIDLFCANYDNNSVTWYENLGSGIFNSAQIITNNAMLVFSVHASDFDLDGDIDVLSASPGDGKFAWYENLGGGVFGSQNVLWSSFSSANYITTADFDNDGDMDVALASPGTLAWMKNNGSMIFSGSFINSTTSTFRSIGTGDIDGDGDLDLLAGTTGKVTYYENFGIGSPFGPQTQIGLNEFNGNYSIFGVDFDGDNDDDLLNASYFDNKLGWYESYGNGNFSSYNPISRKADEIKQSKTADLDGDGNLDVFSASYLDNKISWHKNLGQGRFGDQIIISDTVGNANSIISADFDYDGDIDIVSGGANKISLHINLGNGIFAPDSIITTSVNRVSGLDTADIDGDGLLDIISSSYNDDKIAWYKNLGNGDFSGGQIVISTSANGASTIDAADMDGDFKLDIVTVCSASNQIYMYKNLGLSNFSAPIVVAVQNNVDYVIIADFDLDGDLDIMGGGTGSGIGHMYLYENTSPSVFTYNQSFSFNNVHSAITYDVDGDGDYDIIVDDTIGPNNTMKISYIENLGGNVFAPKRQIYTSTNKYNPADKIYDKGDIDGDGDLDLVMNDFYHDRVTWYENFSYSPYQLKGKVFYDANQNSILDTNELGLTFFQTQIQPTYQSSYSYNNGTYIFAPDTGSYIINYVPNPLWNLTTDSATYNKTLTSINPVIDSLNFGFYPDSIFTIIQPDLTGSFPRCNDTINYWIDIQNQATTIPSGIIHLLLDDSITYINSALIPDSIIGQNIYWSYDSLFFYSHLTINVKVKMPPFTNMGDTLTSFITVHELNTLGNIVYSNTDSLNQISVCAYDPNDKQVLPKGISSEGYIPQSEPFLEYLIRFQNTGTDTANTIMVRDQLDVNLDWNTLQPISSSHSFQAWVEQDGEAVFKFNNIMLPDSGADFLGSQEYIKFRINLKPNLVPGTQILNSSNIYFDNNPAVITNGVINTIYSCDSALISVINSPTCFGENLLANSPEGNVINYLWELDSFYSDSSTTFNWLSDSVGTFNLKLTITTSFCTKTNTVPITILPSLPITTSNLSICTGDSILIAGLYHSSAGIYNDTLQSYIGCDSIIAFNLSLNTVYLNNVNLSICTGDSVLIYGNYQSTPATYYDTLQTIFGCDSVNSSTLTLLPDFVVNQNQSICQGDSIFIGGFYQSTAGLYYDSLQTIAGCDSVLSTTLFINSLPIVSLSAFNPDTLCDNGFQVFLPQANPVGGIYSGNGVGGSNFSPSAAGIGSHNIIYTYTDSNSCANSDTTIVTVKLCLGINEIQNDFGILIYPNPNTGEFTIEKPSGLNKEVGVKLLDARSRVIIDKIIPMGKQKIAINFTENSNGIYYLQLIVDNKVFVKQILKQ